MSTGKLRRMENITMYACYLALSGPTDKENQVRIYKKYRF
jgi:hypothetical protein